MAFNPVTPMVYVGFCFLVTSEFQKIVVAELSQKIIKILAETDRIMAGIEMPLGEGVSDVS
jgi:hypothetical protein